VDVAWAHNLNKKPSQLGVVVLAIALKHVGFLWMVSRFSPCRINLTHCVFGITTASRR
jgi:hypothetical protein